MMRTGAKADDQTEFVRGTILAIRTQTCVSQSDDGRTDHQDSGPGRIATLIGDSMSAPVATRQTIQRLEQHDGLPPSRSQTLEDIRRALEAGGVEFIGMPEDAPGVRLVGQAKRKR
jgi:hypothetical protein